MSHKYDVVVVGAGPVGMICALSLFKQGITVCVLEKEPAPVVDQRAASIHPPTLEMLDQLGIAREIIPRGLVAPTFQYRDRVTGELVAEFDLNLLQEEFQFPFVLQYEQYKLSRDITAKYAEETGFNALYAHEVVGLAQSDEEVRVRVSTPEGEKVFAAQYVVGADGGRSTVRRVGGIAFEGFTYQERFVKIATDFDFQEAHSDYAYRNYFSDPGEWCNLFKVRGECPEGLWRAIFPTRIDEGEEEVLKPEAIQSRLQKFFPKGGDYHVEYCNVYSVSQRVAETFRKGRICLAGDAAHVNNPIGGMGMNGGIHDAMNLASKLAQVLHGSAPDDVLDLYSRQRRFAAMEYVQAQTIANKKLLEERDPEVRRRNLSDLRRTAADPERAKAHMRRSSLLESLRRAEAVT
jgi:3-(3-hydroxy-phenyl)propionate hydroxylase